MFNIDEEGQVTHINSVMAAAVKVPHRRQVLKSLREIHAGCFGTEEEEVLREHLDTVCRFLGTTLEQLVDGQENVARQ